MEGIAVCGHFHCLPTPSVASAKANDNIGLRRRSVSHGVDNIVDADADAEGGEPFGVLRVVGVFPGIAEVHVVADGDHEAAVVVVDAAPVCGAAIALVLFVNSAALQVLRAGDLIAVVEIEDGGEDGVLIGDVHNGAIGEHLLHAVDENFPLVGGVEIVAHEESAAHEEFAEFDDLGVGELPVAHLDGVQPGVIEHVIVFQEIDGLFDAARVNAGEAADGGGKVPVGTGIVDGPVGVAFAPIEAAFVLALPVQADRGSGIHQAGEGPFAGLVPIVGNGEIVVLPGRIRAEGVLREQRTNQQCAAHGGYQESANPHLITSIRDGSSVAAIDAAAGEVDGVGGIAAEEVGELAIVVAIVDGEIGQFAGFEGADFVAAAEAVGGVDGGGGNRLGGCHLQLRGGEGEHHGHGSGGGRPGVKIGGQDDGHAAIDHAARRRVARPAEVVDRGGKQHGLHAGGMQRGEGGGGGSFQMVGGGGMEFGGQQGAIIGAELVGVEAQTEAERPGGEQDGARLFHVKHIDFTEDIAIFGEVFPDHARQHLVYDEVHIVVGTAAIFVGDLVGAQEGGNVAQAGIGVKAADGLEDFDLGIRREPVARFGFDGGGTAGEEPVLVAAGGGGQGGGRSLGGGGGGGG